jgi:UDP-N-acetylmuramate dehydrogenase
MAIKCLKNESLAKYTTFKIGGTAKEVYLPESLYELIDLLKSIDFTNTRPLLLGGGSNVLVSSEGYDGPVIITKNLNKLSLIKNTLNCECGARLPKLALFCSENNLSGFEFLIGIPGSLGGAVFMNCSAHGQSISEKLIEVEVFDIALGQCLILKKEDITFHYRKSTIDPEKQIVLSAKFALEPDSRENIQQRISEFQIFRNTRQPKGFNAGSMFKNPEEPNISSGYLLDKIGAKGWKIGGAEVSKLHANFVNNIQNATSVDVSKLLLRMKQEVYARTGYILHPEIIYVGKPTKEEESIWKILKDH